MAKASSEIRRKIDAAIGQLDPELKHPLTRRVLAILGSTQDTECDAYVSLQQRFESEQAARIALLHFVGVCVGRERAEELEHVARYGADKADA